MAIYKTRLGLVCAFMAVPSLLSAGDPSLAYPESDKALTLEVIAFGSCAKEREPQPVWDAINAHDPDLFLFIGDNNYADVWYQNGRRVMAPVADRARFEEAYSMMNDRAGYVHLRARTPLMATWDDHDYGANDQGKEYALKQVAQEEFWQAFGLEPGNPLWERDGVYHARTFGPEGRRVQVIMLDTRYFRDPLERAAERVNGPYQPTADTATTVLGAKQWRWLESELRKPADVRIIASSIQVIAYEHAWETWGNFPHERQRLFDLIGETGAEGVVFISGDRHLAEVSREMGGDRTHVPYPMWDFTSSGMTDGVQPVDEPNRFRVGPVYRGTNYGLLRINWDDQPATIAFENRDEDGDLINQQAVILSTLQSGGN